MAQRLMDILEEVTESVHRGYFVDLFVRVSNAAAIAMYHKVGFKHAFKAPVPSSGYLCLTVAIVLLDGCMGVPLSD